MVVAVGQLVALGVADSTSGVASDHTGLGLAPRVSPRIPLAPRGVGLAQYEVMGSRVRCGSLVGMWLVLAVVAACGGDPGVDDSPDAGLPDAGPDPSEPLFEPSRVIEVAIEMPEASWDEIRTQNRSSDLLIGADCQAAPFPNPFTTREATVTVDGQRVERAGVRKKGFLGSLDDNKPSLKIDFDEYVPDQEAFGLGGITLNNNKQDPAVIRQCLTYQLFADAGVPAPRCNFAHVTINGRDLGVYTHVEAVKKKFLARHFADNDGRLYEGTLSDFRDGWLATFEAKTNESDPDRSDLEALAVALEASDGELEAALAPHVSVDRFLTFWAMETLVGHQDGYASNTNNFFVYDDPTSGVFEFVPWGVDATMSSGGAPPGAVVVANGILARRLYLLPETRARYLDRLRELLDAVWDEAAIQAEVDRMEALIAPFVDADPSADPDAFAAAVDDVRAFVARRRGDVDAVLDAPPAWDRPLRESFCFVDLGPIAGTFSTTYKTADPPDIFAAGTGTLTGSIEGVPIAPIQLGTNAKPNADGRVEVQLFARESANEILVVIVTVRPDQVAAGPPRPIEFFTAYVFRYHISTGTADILGVLLGGEITFSAGGTSEGSPVVGSFASELFSAPF